jgi:hypothetical protein
MYTERKASWISQINLLPTVEVAGRQAGKVQVEWEEKYTGKLGQNATTINSINWKLMSNGEWRWENWIFICAITSL